MPRHEFGIMREPPGEQVRFDQYEPEKYGCITIDDAYIEPILAQLEALPTFYHTRDVPGKGVAYCGITLIPPGSLAGFRAILQAQDNGAYNPLAELLQQAQDEGRYVIHFGI